MPTLLGAGTLVVLIVAGIVMVFIGGMFLSVVVSIVGAVMASGSQGGWLGAVVFAVPVLIIAAVVTMIVVGLVRGAFGQSERWYRLDRFAAANGMSYVPIVAAPSLPGMIFGLGRARQAIDAVRGMKPRFVEFANYRYTTGSGRNSTTHRWGYVAVKLDVPLPHIVLDAKGNNALLGSNLPASFDADQRLGLEGDFDEHFTLYCPEGYERDALYLFTPDIMARFIDNAAALDVEIVDDWLFLYAKRDFSTLDPATWAWLFSVVGALLDKLAQWARWRDDRLRAEGAPWMTDSPAPGGGALPFAAPTAAGGSPAMLRPPPGVAAQGRRLTRGVSWVSIVVMVAVILFWFLTQTGVLSLFFG